MLDNYYEEEITQHKFSYWIQVCTQKHKVKLTPIHSNSTDKWDLVSVQWWLKLLIYPILADSVLLANSIDSDLIVLD